VASALASSSFFSPAAPRLLTGAVRSVVRPTITSARSAASNARGRGSARQHVPLGPPLGRRTRERHVLKDGQADGNGRGIWKCADAAVDDAMRRGPGDLAPLETDRAAVGTSVPDSMLRWCSCPSRVRADQAKDLALTDLERHVVNRGEAAETFDRPVTSSTGRDHFTA